MPSALAFIRSQPTRYVVASLVGRKYLLALGDVLTVPRLKDVAVGDSISLDNVHELGSRDLTLRGNPTLPTTAVAVRATILEHTKGRLELITKFKRRKGYKRTVKHKQTYTKLRVASIDVPAELRS